MDKPFNIHDWQAKQRKQRLAEESEMNDDEKVSGTPKERLVQTIVNVFSGRLGNWYSEKVTSMNDVDNLFKRDREAIANIIQQHLRDVTINPESVFDKGEIDEMNMTGTDASFNAGNNMGHYGKAKKKIYEDEEEEEELEKDAQKIADHPILKRINTKNEWVDVMQAIIDYGDEEITQVNTPVIKAFLMNAIKDLNKPKA